MKYAHYLVCGLLAALPLAGVANGAEGDEGAPAASVTTLVKVPARAAIAKGADGDQVSKQVAEWVSTLIESKEKRANVELEQIKKELLAQEAQRETESKERRKKEERFNEVYGAVGPRATGRQDGTLRIRLDFYVPEIDTYRAIVETLRQHKALADDVVDALKSLDRDRDGKLALDEYRDAAAIVTSTARLFQSLDQNNDGVITDAEINAARGVPADAADAVKKGRSAGDTPKIKAYDADSDGTLNVDERKALTMAFVEFSLRCAKESEFYRLVQETLIATRDVVGAKFANIEIKP
jgi:Ca2+-binding EF-hand superfamily protein